jgi:hypothetical protein
MRKFALALIMTAAALPMAPAPAADILAAELQPMAFLAGSCWTGAMGGSAVTDTHCFTPMLGGHFLRDRHRISHGRYAGETLYRWDAAARQIRWDYYSSDGFLMSGTASGTEHGLAFEVTAVSPASAAPAGMRITWRRDGSEAYVATNIVWQGEAWREQPNGPRFQRTGPAPAD